MISPIFITGIGTGVGKTLIASILAQALEADYWKPVQAGYSDGTDSEFVKAVLSNPFSKVHPELYRLKLPASPHIAAANEDIVISLERIVAAHEKMYDKNRPLIIEGAGGLLVPLNQNEFVLDLIRRLNARVILVSRNYLGSINHSLLTARVCREKGLQVAGWIFNDQYLDYEDEIVAWSGYPRLATVGKLEEISTESIAREAGRLQPDLSKKLWHPR